MVGLRLLRLAVQPRWFRRLRWRLLVGREVDYLRGLASAGVRPRLAEATFLETLGGASKEFFFILGNGDTVNELTDGDFDFIRNYFSVGLNAWPVHPFVPSAYGFEMWSGLERDNSEFGFLLKTAARKARSRSAALWILRPKPEQLEQLSEIVAGHDDVSLEVYGRANIGSSTREGLRKEIAWELTFLLNPSLRRIVLLDNGASVVRMISLALLTGFKRVILVGVDLKPNPYFWYNPKFIAKFGDFTEICRRHPEEGTDTLQTRDRPFGAHEFIVSMSAVAANTFGSEILVSSGGSALAEALNVFSFPSPDSRI